MHIPFAATASSLEDDPLLRYKFGPTKFFPKTFKFSIIFYSTWQISGGGRWRKACRSRQKNRNSRKSRENSRNLLKAFLRSRKEENLYGHCDMNNARRILSKGSTLLRGWWFFSKKLHFQKNFGRNFKAMEGVRLEMVKELQIKILNVGEILVN